MVLVPLTHVQFCISESPKMVLGIGKRLMTMLDDESMTDVVFDVQGQQFKCHKLILSSCETRLKQLIAESPEVKVDDIAPHTFKAILK